MAAFFSDPVLRELARVYYRINNAIVLLQRAGLDRDIQPTLDKSSPREFWVGVDYLLADGQVKREVGSQVLALALEDYPGNGIFNGAVGGQGIVAPAPSPAPASSPAPAPAPAPSPVLAPAPAPLASSAPPGSSSSVSFTSPAPPGGGPLPVMGAIVVVDAVGYSRHGALTNLEWRAGLRDITGTALRAASIPDELAHFNDRGDGYLAVIDGRVPVHTVAAEFIRQLRLALTGYNRTRNSEGRIRLRIALHLGQVLVDRTGLTGRPAVTAARLVDSPPVRAVLKENEALDTALIVSDDLYESTIVERFGGLEPERFVQIEVAMDKYTGVAWLERHESAGVAGTVGAWDVPNGQRSTTPPESSPNGHHPSPPRGIG